MLTKTIKYFAKLTKYSLSYSPYHKERQKDIIVKTFSTVIIVVSGKLHNTTHRCLYSLQKVVSARCS